MLLSIVSFCSFLSLCGSNEINSYHIVHDKQFFIIYCPWQAVLYHIVHDKQFFIILSMTSSVSLSYLKASPCGGNKAIIFYFCFCSISSSAPPPPPPPPPPPSPPLLFPVVETRPFLSTFSSYAALPLQWKQGRQPRGRQSTVPKCMLWYRRGKS